MFELAMVWIFLLFAFGFLSVPIWWREPFTVPVRMFIYPSWVLVVALVTGWLFGALSRVTTHLMYFVLPRTLSFRMKLRLAARAYVRAGVFTLAHLGVTGSIALFIGTIALFDLLNHWTLRSPFAVDPSRIDILMFLIDQSLRGGLLGIADLLGLQFFPTPRLSGDEPGWFLAFLSVFRLTFSAVALVGLRLFASSVRWSRQLPSRPQHHSVYSQEPARLSRFYADLFGWSVKRLDYQGVSPETCFIVETGRAHYRGVDIAIEHSRTVPCIVGVQDAGFRGCCLAIIVPDMKTYLDRVTRYGGVVQGAVVERTNDFVAFVTDPDGNAIQFVEEKPFENQSHHPRVGTGSGEKGAK